MNSADSPPSGRARRISLKPPPGDGTSPEGSPYFLIAPGDTRSMAGAVCTRLARLRRSLNLHIGQTGILLVELHSTPAILCIRAATYSTVGEGSILSEVRH